MAGKKGKKPPVKKQSSAENDKKGNELLQPLLFFGPRTNSSTVFFPSKDSEEAVREQDGKEIGGEVKIAIPGRHIHGALHGKRVLHMPQRAGRAPVQGIPVALLAKQEEEG